MIKVKHWYTLLITAACQISALGQGQQTTYATQDTVYRQGVEKALAALKSGDCEACLGHYRRAFVISQKSALSNLRAATCAYQCNQVQVAHAYIQKAVAVDWWASEDVWNSKKEYPELNPLRVGSLANRFQSDLDSQKIAAGRNPRLERELQQIFDADQQPRLRADTIGRQYGFQAPEIKPIWTQMQQVDSINVIKIERILQQYGYPSEKLVGDKLSITPWVVIQHAPLALQEKYLPLMQQAVDRGDLAKADLALLIDRIRNRKGQKQLYGSQVHMNANGKPDRFELIEDEPNVNKRRAEMGLPPLEEYAKHWGFEYVLPKK